ncbi:MAG: glycosyltransferase [Planctomycetota bacterium]
MRRAVLVSYYFPPDGGPGTQRSAKLCKYLGQAGWEAWVVTRPAQKTRGAWEPEDATLLGEIGGARILRPAPMERPRGWARAVPNLDTGHEWLEPALEEVLRLLRQEGADLVCITLSPFDLSWIGRRLQAGGARVVYDLRDPWALDGWRLYGSRRRWREDRRAMVETLSAADGVVANTPEAGRALLKAVPLLAQDRLRVIPNGFDGEDFAEGAAPPPTLPKEEGSFELVHAGSLHTRTLYLYEGFLGRLRKWRHYRPERIDTSGRTPLHLLRAVRLLREAREGLAERLRVVFVGPADKDSRRAVEESGVGDRVLFTGYLSHAEAVGRLKRADALFLPLHGLPEGGRSLIVPGKLYEYLAAGKPILACLPEGDAKDLVLESGRGVAADPCDASAIARAMAELVARAEAGAFASSASAPAPGLKRFERRRLAVEMAAFWDELLARRGSAA